MNKCPPFIVLAQLVFQTELLPEGQCNEIVEHLARCESCAEIYDALCDAEERLLDEAAVPAELPKRALHFSRSPEEGLAELWRRIREAEAEFPQRHRTTIFHMGKFVAATAACLAIAVAGSWRLGRPHSKMRAGANSPDETARSAPRADGTIPSLTHESFRPADLERIGYTEWRDAHWDWFAQQFPWLSKVQTVLRGKGVQADYIELLIVSGDIWQFHFDPKLPITQAHTHIESKGIELLARHYHADEMELLRAVDLPTLPRSATSPVEDGMPVQKYVEDLRRWHEALDAVESTKPESTDDVALASLSASGYLATTRAAAYLWTKTYPQQAALLLAGDASFASSSPRHAATTGDEWTKQLLQQAVAARTINQVALEWVAMPAASACEPNVITLRQKLATLLLELAPK